MTTVVARLIAVVVLVCASSTVARRDVASAQESCSLAPVFLMLRDAAGADVIGECQGSSSLTSAGDLVQTTMRGTLVLRVADGVAASTDGTTTWLYGPEGLQSRSNGERFAWESVPSVSAPFPIPPPGGTELPPLGPLPAPAPVAPSLSATAMASRLTETLAARCFLLITGDSPFPADARLGDNTMCRMFAEKWGEAGVVCVEASVRERDQAMRRLSGPDAGKKATDIYLGSLLLCQMGLPK